MSMAVKFLSIKLDWDSVLPLTVGTFRGFFGFSFDFPKPLKPHAPFLPTFLSTVTCGAGGGSGDSLTLMTRSGFSEVLLATIFL